ncbi:MAG: hypothetical protein LM560_00370 [Desulfurococcaceae archaeon]|jgi:UPF0148 protein|nr:hypothetical protein [Desulfurococcaceae archaeon]
MSGSEASIKRMSELLKSGATMLSEACPICSTPLFKLRSGEVICPIHGRVQIVRSDEELLSVTTINTLDELEKFTVNTINRLRRELEEGNSDIKDERDIKLLNTWLEVLERIRRLKILIEHSRKTT